VPGIYSLLGVPGPVSDTPLQPLPVVEDTPTPASPAGPAAGAGTPTATPGIPDEYKVVAGDTLAQIAIRFNTSVEALVAWNDIERADSTFVWQVLRSPKAGQEPPAKPTPPPAPTPCPPEVLAAMSRPMINHRGPEFADLIAR